MKKKLSAVVVSLVVMGGSVVYAQAPAPITSPPAPAMPPAAQKPSWMDYKTPYVGAAGNLSQAHRTGEEIQNWAQQTAAELLTLGPGDFQRKTTTEFQKYFSQSGWGFYQTYLTDTKFGSMLTQNGYLSTAVVEGLPEMLSHGAVSGTYHWILKLPMALSFYSPDPEGFNRTHVSGKYILYLDIARSGAESVVITNWRMDDAPAAPVR